MNYQSRRIGDAYGEENVLLVKTVRGRNADFGLLVYHIRVDWRFHLDAPGIEMINLPDHVITKYLILKVLF